MPDVRTEWWGFKLRLTHPETDSLVAAAAAGGAGVATILTATGVGAAIAAIVAAAMAIGIGWVKASDDGNGVAIYCSWWTGWWYVENPA
jgi:hypothetical protein